MINEQNLPTHTKNYVPPTFTELGLPGHHNELNLELISFFGKCMNIEGVSLHPKELCFYTHSIQQHMITHKQISLCELGAGSSTLYMSFFLNCIKNQDYNASMISLETNESWFAFVRIVLEKLNFNNALIALNKDYTLSWEDALRQIDRKFNVVMIDGRKREDFTKSIVNFIDDDCLIFLHDYVPGASRDAEFDLLSSQFNLTGIVKSLACFRGKLNV